MLEAARRQDVPVARISFADAYRWLRHARPGDVMPPLLVNPHRPGRAEPRVVKRRAKPPRPDKQAARRAAAGPEKTEEKRLTTCH